MKLIIPVAPVTKKNSSEIHVNPRTGKPFVAPSRRFKEYQDTCGYYLFRGDQKIKPVKAYPVNIKCLFYMPTKRRVDLTNLLEAVDDVLVHYGVIEDDSNKYLAAHDGSRVLYNKENPRTEIYITKITAENRAEWQEYDDTLYKGGGYTLCTGCGQRFSFGAYHEVFEFKYCPECGREMYYNEEANYE